MVVSLWAAGCWPLGRWLPAVLAQVHGVATRGLGLCSQGKRVGMVACTPLSLHHTHVSGSSPRPGPSSSHWDSSDHTFGLKGKHRCQLSSQPQKSTDKWLMAPGATMSMEKEVGGGVGDGALPPVGACPVLRVKGS